MMKSRSVSGILLALVSAYSFSAFANQDDQNSLAPTSSTVQPTNSTWDKITTWVSRLEVRYIVMGSTRMKVRNIPNSVSTATEYHGNSPIALPSQTSGVCSLNGFGTGFSVYGLNWLVLTQDFTTRHSYNGGRTTWSEIGFSSDDYIGYAYNGRTIDFSFKVIPLSFSIAGFELVQAYFKSGIQQHSGTLSSGSDAWNAFTPQNGLAINGYSYTFGAGFIVPFISVEYLHGISFARHLATHDNQRPTGTGPLNYEVYD